MDITFEKLDNVNAKLIANVTEADYADKVTAKLKEIGRTHQIPGFRKGHIDIAQLRRRFGRDVKSDVLNHEVYDAVIKYISDNKLSIIGYPMPVEKKEINLTDKDYTFEYRVGLLPEVNVTIDKSDELPYYNIELTDEMVKNQDKDFCERFGQQTTGDTVDAKALVKGPIMELNPDGTVKETEDAIQVTAGMVAPFLFKSDEQREKFMGKHVDDKVDFNPWATCDGNATELSSMLNIDKDKAADVKADFRMTISEIMVLKPAEHNQELYDNIFGKDKVHNEEEYEQAVRDFINSTLVDNSRRLFARDAQRYLANKYADMELPREFIRSLISENGAKEITDEELDAAIAEFRWSVILDRACQALGITVTEDDMMARTKVIAREQFMQYGMYNLDDETIADAAKRILSNKEYSENIHNDVRQGKLYAAMQQVVTLKPETVSLEKFREICK